MNKGERKRDTLTSEKELKEKDKERKKGKDERLIDKWKKE
jgi:hypothetical protein